MLHFTREIPVYLGGTLVGRAKAITVSEDKVVLDGIVTLQQNVKPKKKESKNVSSK